MNTTLTHCCNGSAECRTLFINDDDFYHAMLQLMSQEEKEAAPFSSVIQNNDALWGTGDIHKSNELETVKTAEIGNCKWEAVRYSGRLWDRKWIALTSPCLLAVNDWVWSSLDKPPAHEEIICSFLSVSSVHVCVMWLWKQLQQQFMESAVFGNCELLFLGHLFLNFRKKMEVRIITRHANEGDCKMKNWMNHFKQKKSKNQHKNKACRLEVCQCYGHIYL